MDMAQAAFELDSTYGIMTRVGLHCAPNAHKTLEHTRMVLSVFLSDLRIQSRNWILLLDALSALL